MKSWQNWCRLCAKINWSDEDAECKMESILDQLEIINKYLLISPQPYDGTMLICNDCSSFLGKLENFRNRCLNADQMFQELKKEASQTEDLNWIRLKYGFEQEEIKEESYENIVFDDIHSNPLESVYETKEPIIVKLETPYDEPEKTQKKRGRPKKATVSSKVQQENQNNDKKTEIPDEEKKEDVTEDDDEPLIKHKKPTKKNRYIKKIKKPRKENICEICSKKFRAPCYLRDHIWAQHRKEERPFVCSECQKRFTTKRCLMMHMTVHLPDEERLIHPCQYCDKKFSQKVSAEVHMNTVHNLIEKTFVCEECGKSFTTKTNLKQHIDTHIEVRNLKCPFCPKMFKNTHRLSQHKTFHKDTVHPCPHCNAKLGSKVSLKTHLLIHSDVKQYKCNYCGNEFRRPKDLKHHLFLHTGEKPYECPFCDKTFTNGTNCRTHQKKIHPVEFAAREASREPREVIKLPKLEYLQSKSIPLE